MTKKLENSQVWWKFSNRIGASHLGAKGFSTCAFPCLRLQFLSPHILLVHFSMNLMKISKKIFLFLQIKQGETKQNQKENKLKQNKIKEQKKKTLRSAGAWIPKNLDYESTSLKINSWVRNTWFMAELQEKLYHTLSQQGEFIKQLLRQAHRAINIIACIAVVSASFSPSGRSMSEAEMCEGSRLSCLA